MFEQDRFGRPYDDMSGRIGHFIEWFSVPTGEIVTFKAFLTEFKDSYASEWNDQETFGRMDPISTFKRTTRKINLAWDVPAATVDEAKLNLEKAEKFLSMLYPVYEEISIFGNTSLTPEQLNELEQERENALATNTNDGTIDGVLGSIRKKMLEENKANASIVRTSAVMSAAPLFKLKFSNLIMDNKDGVISAGVKSSGLVGKLSGLTYEPDIEQGFFGHTIADNVPAGTLIPQTIKFSCEFTVLHTTPLGWNKATKTKRTNNFPYNYNKIGGGN